MPLNLTCHFETFKNGVCVRCGFNLHRGLLIQYRTRLSQTFLNFERYPNVTCMQHELGLPSIAVCVCGEILMELGSVFCSLVTYTLIVSYRHCQCLCISLCVCVVLLLSKIKKVIDYFLF